MEGVQVSIDRIVVDFTDVFWEFFNPFQQRLKNKTEYRAASPLTELKAG